MGPFGKLTTMVLAALMTDLVQVTLVKLVLMALLRLIELFLLVVVSSELFVSNKGFFLSVFIPI